MAINPMCDMCGQELTEFGAILFSPPDAQSSVKKYHICKHCYNDLLKQME